MPAAQPTSTVLPMALSTMSSPTRRSVRTFSMPTATSSGRRGSAELPIRLKRWSIGLYAVRRRQDPTTPSDGGGPLREIARVLKPGGWRRSSSQYRQPGLGLAKRSRDGSGFEFHEAVSLDRKQQSHKGYKGRDGQENVAHFDVVMNLRKPIEVSVQTATPAGGRDRRYHDELWRSYGPRRPRRSRRVMRHLMSPEGPTFPTSRTSANS